MNSVLKEKAVYGQADGKESENQLNLYSEKRIAIAGKYGIEIHVDGFSYTFGNIHDLCNGMMMGLPRKVFRNYNGMTDYQTHLNLTDAFKGEDEWYRNLLLKYQPIFFRECLKFNIDPEAVHIANGKFTSKDGLFEYYDFRDYFRHECMDREDLDLMDTRSNEAMMINNRNWFDYSEFFWDYLPRPFEDLSCISGDGAEWFREDGVCGLKEAFEFIGYHVEGDVQEFQSRASRFTTLKDLQTPHPGDHSELLQDRYLCRGGLSMTFAPTGIGKSVIGMQGAIYRGLGIPFFGIRPVRPLITWVFQSENDEGDLAEFRDGITTLLLRKGVNIDHIRRVLELTRIYTERSLTGDKFIDYIDNTLAEGSDLPDMIEIDPLYAFLGDDVCNQKAVSCFLRNRLNPILAKYNIGSNITHHIPKPSKDSKIKIPQAYAGAGSAELSNFPRAILTLEPTSENGIFKLIASKRGTRLGWKDQNGNTTITRFIAHSQESGLIYWREPEPEEIAGLMEEENRAGRKKINCRGIADRMILDLVRPVEIKAFQAKIQDKYCIGRDKARDVISLLLDNGKVIMKRGEGNKRLLVASDS